MKGNTKAIALSIAAIFALSIFAMGAMAAKPAPSPPPYVEPTGNLVITSGPQLVLTTGGYVRLYDWVNGKFSHTWSAASGNMATIGDVDNDGTKEVVSKILVATQVSKKVTTYKNYIRVWNNGDPSNSPSIIVESTNPSSCSMEIGDVDQDGKNELVISGTDDYGSAEVWSCTASTCTKKATIPNLGYNGITVADADSDGYPEIIMGAGTGAYSQQPVIADYNNGAYSVTALPMSTKCSLDELSVGNIDNVAGNEIFGSGYCNGNLFVWKYANGAYSQVWNKQIGNCFDMSNEIADINGDGSNEIAFTEYCPYTDGSNTLRVYGYDGNGGWSQLGAYAGSHGNHADVMVSADVDGDGAKELVVQNQVWDWDGSAMKNIQELALINNQMMDSSLA